MSTQGIQPTTPNLASASAAVSKAETNSTSQLPGGFEVLFLAMILASEDMSGQLKQTLLPRVLQEQKTDIFVKDIENCNSVSEVFEVCFNQIKSQIPDLEGFLSVLSQFKNIDQTLMHAVNLIGAVVVTFNLHPGKYLQGLFTFVDVFTENIATLTKHFYDAFKDMLEGTGTLDTGTFMNNISTAEKTLANLEGGIQSAITNVSTGDNPHEKALVKVLNDLGNAVTNMEKQFTALGNTLSELPSSISRGDQIENNGDRFAYNFTIENMGVAARQEFYGYQINPDTQQTQTQAFIDEAKEVGSRSQYSLGIAKQMDEAFQQIFQQGMSIISTDQQI